MHSVTLVIDPACRHQIRTKWVIFGQICSEIHLLPLESFAEVVFSWKAKFSQMPALNEVNLAIFGTFIYLIGMFLSANQYLIWEFISVSSKVTQQEGILLPGEPSFLGRKLKHPTVSHFACYHQFKEETALGTNLELEMTLDIVIWLTYESSDEV